MLLSVLAAFYNVLMSHSHNLVSSNGSTFSNIFFSPLLLILIEEKKTERRKDHNYFNILQNASDDFLMVVCIAGSVGAKNDDHTVVVDVHAIEPQTMAKG